MNINIKATDIELTQAIRDYVEEKVSSLDKFTESSDGENLPEGMHDDVQAWVEVGMTTKHHQSGNIFRAEIQIRLSGVGKSIRSESEKDSLYAAIDEAKEEIKEELKELHNKKRKLLKKGARLFKKINSIFK